MDASQLFKSGNLAGAIDEQIAVVKAKPNRSRERLFLSSCFAFAGENSIAPIGKSMQSSTTCPKSSPPSPITNSVLEAERLRRLVFGKKGQPELLAPPPDHVRLRLLGLMKLADGATAEAAEAFDQANSQILPSRARSTAKPFDSLRDGDDCLGSILEVHSKGRYFWVPLEQVEAITMNAPRFPRDLLWVPAHLEMKEGDAGSVFLPALFIPAPIKNPTRSSSSAD